MNNTRRNNHPARTLSADPLFTKFADLTELGIALRCGVSETSVATWRRGGRMRYSTAERIAAKLGTTVADLWFGEGA